MLTSNTLGLPVYLEADLKNVKIEEAVMYLRNSNKMRSLILRNVDNIDELIIKAKPIFPVGLLSYSEETKTAFVNKDRKAYQVWKYSSDVKRKLIYSKTVVDLGSTLYISNLSVKSEIFKGMNYEQFRKDFLTKDYEFFAINSEAGSAKSLLTRPLEAAGYSIVSSFLIKNLDRQTRYYYDMDHIWLFGKGYRNV